MERELVMSGIGGQGVQLACTVLASAALSEGREVQLFGSYGGMMRGGATEATLVVADGPILAPPTLGSAWSAVLMHHEHSEHARSVLGRGSIALVNSTVAELTIEEDGVTVIEVPATAVAIEQGNAMAASMVMLGAYVAATGMVSMSSVTEASRTALPAYRRQHAELNHRALSAGAAVVDGVLAPAWSGSSVR